MFESLYTALCFLTGGLFLVVAFVRKVLLEIGRRNVRKGEKAIHFTSLKDGDRQCREEFLLFPKSIDGEVRWLTTAKWEEKYESSSYPSLWWGTKWIDE
jgi:hypothetical protein